MKKLSKGEWIAVGVGVIFVGFTLFGGNIMSLFQKNLMNNNPSAAVAEAGSNSNTSNNNGVIIKDDVVGQGVEVKQGQIVSINYNLTLLDGTPLQNSKDSGQPFKFTYGVDKMIAGWDMGLVGMKVGGVRTVTIPPELAYGSQQNGPVPPNSTLVFTIELLDVTDVPTQ